MNKAEIISRHAQALKGQVGTSLAIDECKDIMASMMNEAINFIHCSTQLKEKEVDTFDVWLKKCGMQKVGNRIVLKNNNQVSAGFMLEIYSNQVNSGYL